MMRPRPILLVIVPLLLLAACTPAKPQDQGSLEVRVQDHERAIDHFQSAAVTISGLAIHPATADWEADWRPLSLEPVTMDLTQLVGGPYAVIFRDALASSTFDGVRIEVSEARGVLKDGTEVSIDLPEDSALFFAFGIQPGQETVLLLDLVVVSKEEHGGGYGLQLASASVVWE